MTSITLIVTGASIRAEVNGVLTSGMVGIPVSIQYDDAWKGLTRNLVCRCGKWGPAQGDTRTILNVGATASVAHEVMQAEHSLFLGIEGYSTDGTLVMPTIWASCGFIHPGANADADPSGSPNLSLWAQLQTMIGDLDKLDTEARANLVEAINEAAKPCGGSNVDLTGYVKSVNGKKPDENGNVEIAIPDSGGNAAGLTQAEKTLILTLFRNAAYISANMGNTLTDLENLWSESGEDDGGDTHSHAYTSVITAATCTTDGKKVYTCSCGDSYTVKIPATGHTYVDGVCTVCGAVDPNYTPDEPDKPSIPEITLTHIAATYSGGDVPVGTAVADLTGIVVTAYYSNGTTALKTDYTLSGTIAEGSNTITVIYGDKTATFVVTGVAESSGDDSADETVVNLFDKDTMIVADKFVNNNGTWGGAVGAYGAVIPVEPNTTYALQLGTLNTNFAAYLGSIALWDESQALIARAISPDSEFKDSDFVGIGVNIYYDASGLGHTFTTTADTAFVAFTVKLNDDINYLDTTMLEIGSVCHDYVPYVGGE